MTKKICLLIFYYGKLPSYLSIFLKGAEFNSQIDFKIITDNSPPPELPTNVVFENITIDEFCKLASKKIGIDIHKSIDPYKFCDFRPGYGLIMEDYLQAYDYWGYCDLDMIMGDLISFLKPRIGYYDLISSRKTWMHGPLSLYKNTPTINKLFQKSGDWQKVFESKHYLGFDETGKRMGKMREAIGRSDNFLALKNLPLPSQNDIESITDVAYKFKSSIKIYAQEMVADTISRKEKLRYKSGRILDASETEWPSYHWVIEKKLNQFGYPKWSKVPDEFIVSRYGFFDSSIVNTWTYKLQILKKDIFGKINDARDIIWLIKNKSWNTYYHNWYLESNPIITRTIELLINPKYAD